MNPQNIKKDNLSRLANLSRLVVWREWFGHGIYPILFCFSLLVSLGAYLTLDSLQTAVDGYIVGNQKAMVGGDVIVQSNAPFTEDIEAQLSTINDENLVVDHQFNAMAYAREASLLVRIKSVDDSYPLYGDLLLSKGKNFTETLTPGSVLVERQVLTGLELSIGDDLQIGESTFTIADEIIEEPDRPLTAFGFGARVMMGNADLAATGLMGQKSRVTFRAEIKADESKIPELLATFKTLTENTKVKVSTADDSNTSISLLSNNFLNFLKLLVVAVIVLSGVGLMSVVKAFVNRQQQTNAIRRALGEPMIQLKNSYYSLLLMMTVVAVILAALLSMAVLYFGYDVFAAIIPAQVTLSLSPLSVLKVAVIALGLTFLMTHSTIQSLTQIKPVAVLHAQESEAANWSFSKTWLLVALTCLYLLLSLELASWWQGLQVTGGLIAIALVFWLFSLAMLKALKALVNKGWINHWLMKLSVQNIFRKGNHSMLFFTTLSMAVMVMGSIAALDHTIEQQLVNTYPEDSPNMFLLDVQSDQHDTLDELIGEAVIGDSLTYYPVIRARLESVNGVPVETLKEQLDRYDDVMRVFNLSYADEVLPTEKLTQSLVNNSLFDGLADDVTPISILNSFAEFLQVGLNDQITFNIQGIKKTVKIASIRARHQRGPSPFFYFIFQPEVMKNAPQIQFATAQVSAERVPELQTAIAKALPGITTLDGASIAKQLKGFVDQLTQLIQIFTGLSIVAGLMIFATSLVSTSQDRLKDSAYFRLMGMQSKDLYAINVIEFVLLGLLAFAAGGSLAWLASYLITTQWFALPFTFPWALALQASLVLFVVLVIISLSYGRFVIKSNVMNLVRKMVG